MPYPRLSPIDNRLLTSLPASDRQRVLGACQTVDLELAEVLNLPGRQITHVYFPLASFISLIAAVDDENSLEVGMVGNEGMLGVPLALGESDSPLLAQVQGGGPALRMTAGQFRDELSQSPALKRCLRRYVHVLMAQLAQSVALSLIHI